MERWEMDPGEVLAFLRAYQAEHGPSQFKLAERTGTTQAAVSHFLSGRWATWRVATGVRVATGLGLKMKIVFERPD